MLGELGLNTTAAGFAIYLDSMIEAATMENIKQQKEHKVLVIFSDNRFIEALEYSEGCRKQGITVNLINCSDISDTEQYCKQYGYDEILNFE